MARTGVSYDEVATSIQVLEKAGLNPSIRNIREQLGNKGSLTTIAEHKRAFEAERDDGPTEALPDALTQGLLKGAKIYWAELVEAAQADIDRAERATAEVISKAQTTEAAAVEKHDVLRDQLGQCQATLAERDQALHTSQIAHEALDKKHRQQLVEAATLTEALKAARASIDQGQAQIKQATKDLAKADREQQRLNDHLDAQDTGHTREIATLKEHLADQLHHLASANANAEALTAELRELQRQSAEHDKNEAVLSFDVDRLSRDNRELKDENACLAILSGDLQSKINANEGHLTELKQGQVKLIDEKDARIADLIRERTVAAVTAKKSGPRKKVTK